MKVLVACEYSGTVRDAFIKNGHDAWSCDLSPTESLGPHIIGDVSEVVFLPKWDLVIAHPPCTDLSVSGAKHFWYKRKNGTQQRSIEFFMMFTKLKCNWVIENPISIMSTKFRKPDQIIQPWQFGHNETKATCLWLNGLPKLTPTNIVEGRENKIWKMSPSKHRGKLRSKTYSGIANAMAEQWGGLVS